MISINIRKHIQWLLSTIVLLVSNTMFGQDVVWPDSLSKEAKVSIVVAQQGTQEVYTVYGHAALRIKDPVQHLDVTFNYGIFSFTPDFLFRFIEGKTYYMVMPFATSDYMAEYLDTGRNVTELNINLKKDEIQKVWRYLMWNIQPKNATYLYNFFFDNCATRPIAILLKATNGKLIIPKVHQTKTWRQLINQDEKGLPWLLFGTDLALGVENDQIPTLQQTFFLPEYVVKYLPHTKLLRPDGSVLPLVENTIVYHSVIHDVANSSIANRLLTPQKVFFVVCLISILICFRERKSSFLFNGWMVLLYVFAGIAGCILCYLTFISTHPHTAWNLNLWVLHPFYLFVGVPLIFIKRWVRVYMWYHFVIFVSLTAFLLSAYFLPQTFNVALIFIAIALWSISASYIWRYYKQRSQVKK